MGKAGKMSEQKKNARGGAGESEGEGVAKRYLSQI